jgi:predicted secreted protein
VLAVVVGILTAGCGGGQSLPVRIATPADGADRIAEVTTFKAETTTISVRPGQRFRIAFRQNPSIGDNWQLRQPPASTMIAATGTDYVPDDKFGGPGTGGTLYLLFDAVSPGRTTMIVRNCWRAGAGCAVRPEDAFWATTLRFTVAVEP